METLILFLCLLKISSAADLQLCIIGGNDTEIEKFPFQVSIKETGTNTHVAAGAIITEKFIITAAHCITRFPNLITEHYIFVGSTELSGKSQTHDIEDAISHSRYNSSTKLNDIGIIGIKNKFTFNELVKPVSILTYKVPVGTNVTVSGWGYTSYPMGNHSETLQMISSPIISKKQCKEMLKEADDLILRSGQFCTLEKIDKGTCMGDSGGPVTLNGMLIGVVSCGEPCATGKPDVHTKVAKYIKWIKTTINTYCKTRTCPKNELYPKIVRMKNRRSCLTK